MSKPIRLIIQQPSLAKYRVPVFRELAKHNDIDFTLLYGARHDLVNVEPDGFDAQPVKLWNWCLAGQRFYWHMAQWSSASRQQTDVLLLTWNPRYLSFIPSLLRAKWQGVPVILWGHGASQHDTSIRVIFRRFIAKLATALLFYNKRVAQEWRDAGRAPESIFVATNSLDQEPIRKAREMWQEPGKLELFKRENGLNKGPVLLFVSRLYPANRLDLLLKAIPALERQFPELQLVIVGKGDDERARLESLAASLRITQRIRYTGPIYDEMQLAPWFLSADVFTYPTYIGLSLLHAFGYGLPVITSDNPKSHGPEIDSLRDGENGLLYKEGDVAAFAEAIRTLLSDNDLRARMAVEAIRTVTEEACISTIVSAMADATRFCAAQVNTSRH